MQGFSTPNTTSVTLTRGDESLTFTLCPYPAGFRAALMSAFPPPMRYVDGKPAGEDIAKRHDYVDLLGFLLIAKGLESSGVLSSPAVNLSQPANVIEKGARAIRDEFRAANITDGEIAALADALTALVQDVQKGSSADRGNFNDSSPQSPAS